MISREEAGKILEAAKLKTPNVDLAARVQKLGFCADSRGMVSTVSCHCAGGIANPCDVPFSQQHQAQFDLAI